MKIRTLEKKDFAELIDIGVEFHKGSRFRVLPYEKDHVENYLNLTLHGMERGDHCFFVAESSGGEIIGLLHGVIDRFLFCGELTATEHVFYVKKDYRHTSAAIRLLMAFQTWAQNREASEVNIRLNSGSDTAPVQGMLAKTGYELSGWGFSKWIKPSPNHGQF